MKKIFALILVNGLFFTSFAQYKYPNTKMVNSSDTYFGVTYNDSYRWLEYIEQPEVETWFKEQADYTNSILNKLNGRDDLIAEWKELDKLQPPRIRSVVYENDRIFYRKTMPSENVSKLYYREGINGKEVLLFDPLDYIKGKTLTIESAIPSFDGKKIAIGYSEQGAEVSTIKVMEIDSRRFLKDSIYPAAGILNWTFDNNGLFYMSIKSADNKDPESRLNPKTKLHILDSAQNIDTDFFSNGSYPKMAIDPGVYPYAFLTKDSNKYIFSGLGSVQPELIQYYASIKHINSKNIPWRVLCNASDKLVRSMAIIGDDVYAITYNNAKNYKVVATNLQNPDWNNAVTIAAEKPNQTVEYFTYSKEYLLMVFSDGINNHLSKYNFKTKTTTVVKLPYSGTIDINCINTKNNNCTLGITSWNKPYTEFDYDAATDALTASSFNQPSVYPDAYKDLQVEEVEVKGHDGVMIPLTIIYKKGIKLDGSNVCLMDGYGAYGSSAVPYFSIRKNALAVKGVVLGIPHIRGGSEKGEAWYRAGYKTTKPNTWKDFISCTEYMVEKGYTSPSKLAGTGTSAGGILISRAITERPDLFAAAICNVGCANAMRLEFGANGPVNIPEFGTVNDPVECKALYEMDGMQHVIKGVKYPAVLCVAGWNDSRVVPWQPGKLAAAMQNASSSDKPVLMKVNYDNGHFTEDKNVTYANFADQFAFAMWQCGHPAFQMK
ncbi:MAG: prolyl oligopeptidase family serine peptidase [Flavobacterium sp.]